jgi:hypothetical protein
MLELIIGKVFTGVKQICDAEMSIFRGDKVQGRFANRPCAQFPRIGILGVPESFKKCPPPVRGRDAQL